MPIEVYPIVDREQWLEWRKRDVTASDVAAVCGLSPYKSALRVWAEKSGHVQGIGDNELMRRGRWLEPAVLEAIREREPTWEINRQRIYVRDSSLRIGCTPDALAYTSEGPTLIQAKTVSRPVYDAWLDGEPPLAYTLQAITEGMLMEMNRIYVASLVIDTYEAHLDMWRIPLDRIVEAQEGIKRAVAKFWSDVERGIQPTADYALDEELLAVLRPPKPEMEAIDLSLDNRIAEVLAERADLTETMSIERDRLSALNAEIIDKLGGSPLAFTADYRISHKEEPREGYVVQPSRPTILRITKRRGK